MIFSITAKSFSGFKITDFHAKNEKNTLFFEIILRKVVSMENIYLLCIGKPQKIRTSYFGQNFMIRPSYLEQKDTDR